MSSLPEVSVFSLPDGGHLAYRLSHPAEPQRPTVVLSGMLATTGAVWDDVAVFLHGHGFRTLAFDHPGHGGSSAPSDPSTNTFEAMADNVKALVASIQQDESLFAWIGCSLGAATGVVYASRFPHAVRRLVVCDTVTTSPSVAGIEDAFSPRVAAIRASGSLEATLAGTRERWLGAAWLDAHPEAAAKLTQVMAQTTIDGYAAAVAALVAPSFDLNTHNAPKLLQKDGGAVERVLVVVGEKDLPLPTTLQVLVDKINAASPAERVALHIVPNAGHASFIDGFDAWTKLVLPFLQ